jgi:DNA-binding winged helix-turn-helix (wHTH) protein
VIFRFGEFDVDMALFQLSRGHVPVRLERLVFDLMVYLIEERRRVVLRHQLVARLWPRETVAPTGLARVVSTLRTALGDDAIRPCYIETIRGRGYRFIHPVSELREPAPAEPVRRSEPHDDREQPPPMRDIGATCASV